jgi:hypothetical protein
VCLFTAPQQVVALWLWLSNRFEEEAFPGRHKVDVMARQLCAWMGDSLASRRASPAAPRVLQQQAAAARQVQQAGKAATGALQEEEEAIDFTYQKQQEKTKEEGAAAAQVQTMGGSGSSAETSSPSWSQSSAAASAWADVSSEEESDWEDADSPLADGAGLQLHVVHQHHHVGSVGGSSSSSMLASGDGMDAAATTSSGTATTNSRPKSGAGFLSQRQVLPWVQEVNRAVAAGQVEEVLQPAWDSSMWRYVTCKSGWHSRLVVPPPPDRSAAPSRGAAEAQLQDR